LSSLAQCKTFAESSRDGRKWPTPRLGICSVRTKGTKEKEMKHNNKENRNAFSMKKVQGDFFLF
jgi:hypothetical protein